MKYFYNVTETGFIQRGAGDVVPEGFTEYDINNLPSVIVEFDAAVEKEWIANQYSRLRKAEYPPMEDYLDAVVKGDDVAIQAYIDACIAVKEKYPKP